MKTAEKNAKILVKDVKGMERNLKSRITIPNVLHSIWKIWCFLCRLVDAAMTVGIILMIYLYVTQPETAIQIAPVPKAPPAFQMYPASCDYLKLFDSCF